MRIDRAAIILLLLGAATFGVPEAVQAQQGNCGYACNYCSVGHNWFDGWAPFCMTCHPATWSPNCEFGWCSPCMVLAEGSESSGTIAEALLTAKVEDLEDVVANRGDQRVLLDESKNMFVVLSACGGLETMAYLDEKRMDVLATLGLLTFKEYIQREEQARIDAAMGLVAGK